MNTSLTHLPEPKRQELYLISEILKEEISPLMIILFGSYARGDWVEDLDPETLYYRYQSDFDILVVMRTEREASKVEQNNKLDQRLAKAIRKTPISLIAEDIQFINRRLRKAQYFYIDIKKEGIILFDNGEFELAEPKELSPKERKHLAEEDFHYWFNSAKGFLRQHEHAVADKELNIAAFNLHQTTERLYGTILLVLTRYKPSTHDLKKLSQRVASIEPRFLTAFPQGTEEEKRMFQLLRKAYVDARYKPSYTITEDELAWLVKCVKRLQQLTEKVCQEKIKGFE